MGIVDLYNGELTQYKQGAAPTYIIHSEGIEVLCGASLPIGVLPEAECDVIHQELEPEDRLVMVSDGAFGDEEDMCEILRNWIRRTARKRWSISFHRCFCVVKADWRMM